MLKAAFLLIIICSLLTRTQAGMSQDFTSAPIPSEPATRKLLADWIHRRQSNIGIVAGMIDRTGRRIIGYGRLDENDPRTPNGNTIFEIGSITKVFTSLLLADMARNGEVALVDPVSKYLPKGTKVPGRHGRVITLEDLSRHRSGLPLMPLNFPPINPKIAYRRYSPNDLYRFLAFYQLRRDIGSEFEYSNLGAGMLGYVLSRAAGKNYEELLRSRILEPLKMNSTAITLDARMQSRLAPGHDLWFEPGPNWDIGEVFAGAGALRSTVNDLLTFLAAQMGDGELTPAMTATRSHWQPALSGMTIGLGWLKLSADSKEIIWHGGATGSYCAFAGFDPVSKSGAVVLTNVQTPTGAPDEIGFRLLGLEIHHSPPWALIAVVGFIGASIFASHLRGHGGGKPDPAAKVARASFGSRFFRGSFQKGIDVRIREERTASSVQRLNERAMESPSVNVIDVQNLFFSYQSLEVLHGISFRIRRGEMVGLLGPNGAGKSTTLKTLSGILPASSGKVRIGGYSLPEEHLKIKRLIGYLPEAPLVYECLSGIEFLEFMGRLQGLEENVLQSRIRVLLETFELSNVRVPRISGYSKGMRQKVLLSAALLHNPEVLLLDEPLSGLDVESSILIKDLLTALSLNGTTILYSSHVLDVVEKVCHRILVIDHGSLIADAPLEELKSRTNEKSLEDIFRKLTHSEDTGPKIARVMEVLQP